LSFYRLQISEDLPAGLRRAAPELTWISGLRPGGGGVPIVTGRPSSAENAGEEVLVSRVPDGEIRCHFDLPRTIEDILLERYHSGMLPTLEMRLPFNYSRIPQWVKGIGLAARSGRITHSAETGFPATVPKFAADWLTELAGWAGLPASGRLALIRWPEGFRAALTITHDVDTGWLFANPDWLERICDAEENSGFFGAWYCVPCHSAGARAERAIERLRARGCEVGCHGYNHDAKWPLLKGAGFDRRLRAASAFRDRWGIKGFRSEWLWRTPRFLSAIATVFDYDSSVPTVSSLFTRMTRNGCGTCRPYLTEGNLVELPLTLPMDENRYMDGLEIGAFWERQIDLALKIIEQGGLVTISLHPQPHQAANYPTLAQVDRALRVLSAQPGVWIARPDRIAEHVRDQITRPQPT
jgi:peptidoglycan/xylan/chitin deacetylase (PgdA/CDA1 family)